MTRTLLAVLLLASIARPQSATAPPAANSATPSATFDIPGIMGRVEQSAQGAALQIAALRIEKWKTDSQAKQHARVNADSLQRNMTTALPTLTGAVRSAPQDLSANFKLYRNLSALSDVLNSLTESAGAFGPKQEFQSLAQYAGQFEESRRALGDYLESLTAAKEAELARLRSAAPAVNPSRPKRVIVDNEPEAKPKAKKPKPQKP
jgi:hypothetical protein